MVRHRKTRNPGESYPRIQITHILYPVFETDFIVTHNRLMPSGCALMTLRRADGRPLEPCLPGQFVQVETSAPGVMLRRPISICDITNDGQLVLFVKPVGDGSSRLASAKAGDKFNIVMPLGNGFTLRPGKALLVGGGIGAAPLVMLSKALTAAGVDVTVALGGRTAADVEGLEALYHALQVAVSTDDGSCGEPGVITRNSVFSQHYESIYCCGPTPMMRAVADIAAERGMWCEVSLENRMACGIGACLCCVQEVHDSNAPRNACVCTEGPVFNASKLKL